MTSPPTRPCGSLSPKTPSPLRNSDSSVLSSSLSSSMQRLIISDRPASSEEVLAAFEKKITTYTRLVLHIDDITKKKYVEDTKRILIDNSSLLAGEEILFCLFYLAILNASVDAQPPIHFILDTLCDLALPLFSGQNETLFESLYGTLEWVIELEKSLTSDIVLLSILMDDFPRHLQSLKQSRKSALFCTCNKPHDLQERHPWQVFETYKTRTIVHHWYALCFWITKLFPLASKDACQTILIHWMQKPRLTHKARVDATWSLYFLQTYFQPQESEQIAPGPVSPMKALVIVLSPRSCRKKESPSHPFVSYCQRFQEPVTLDVCRSRAVLQDFCWAMIVSNTTCMVQMHFLQILTCRYNSLEAESMNWVLELDNVGGDFFSRYILHSNPSKETLFSFFPIILASQTMNFDMRKSIALNVLKTLETQTLTFSEFKSILMQFVNFIEKATAEKNYQTLDTLVIQLCKTTWQLGNSKDIFLAKSTPDGIGHEPYLEPYNELNVFIKVIEEKLKSPKAFQDLLKNSYIQVLILEISMLGDNKMSSLIKPALLEAARVLNTEILDQAV